MEYTTPIGREPWVDAETVAAHLGFEADHIRKMARAGKLPGVQMQNGKRVYWRFKLSEIDAEMERQAKTAIHTAMPMLSAIADTAVQA